MKLSAMPCKGCWLGRHTLCLRIMSFSASCLPWPSSCHMVAALESCFTTPTFPFDKHMLQLFSTPRAVQHCSLKGLGHGVLPRPSPLIQCIVCLVTLAASHVTNSRWPPKGLTLVHVGAGGVWQDAALQYYAHGSLHSTVPGQTWRPA